MFPQHPHSAIKSLQRSGKESTISHPNCHVGGLINAYGFPFLPLFFFNHFF